MFCSRQKCCGHSQLHFPGPFDHACVHRLDLDWAKPTSRLTFVVGASFQSSAITGNPTNDCVDSGGQASTNERRARRYENGLARARKVMLDARPMCVPATVPAGIPSPATGPAATKALVAADFSAADTVSGIGVAAVAWLTVYVLVVSVRVVGVGVVVMVPVGPPPDGDGRCSASPPANNPHQRFSVSRGAPHKY